MDPKLSFTPGGGPRLQQQWQPAADQDTQLSGSVDVSSVPSTTAASVEHPSCAADDNLGDRAVHCPADTLQPCSDRHSKPDGEQQQHSNITDHHSLPSASKHIEQQQPRQEKEEAEDAYSCTVPVPGASYDVLKSECDVLPRHAAEGAVLPEATFEPADHYQHTTTHTAVMALYELIGACLSTNTDNLIQDHMAPVLDVSGSSGSGGGQDASTSGRTSTGSSMTNVQSSGQDAVRPGGAWMAHDLRTNSGTLLDDSTDDSSAQAVVTATQQQQLQPKQQQSVSAVRWYDARARVAVKRVAHWLRVPWPQVRRLATRSALHMCVWPAGLKSLFVLQLLRQGKGLKQNSLHDAQLPADAVAVLSSLMVATAYITIRNVRLMWCHQKATGQHAADHVALCAGACF